MMRWPRSLYGRMVLLMGVGLVVAQLLGSALLQWDRHRSLSHTVSHELAERIAAVYRSVGSTDPLARDSLLIALSTPLQRLSLVSAAPADVAPGSMLDDLPGHVREVLHHAVAVRSVVLPRLGEFRYELYLQLAPDEWLRVEGRAPEGVFAVPWKLILNLTLMLLATLGLVALAARATARPLTDLARAANALSADLRQPPLPEEGPSEVLAATQAFNAMQARLRQGIEEREHFLAAVSHDLKTPLTRMRLRTEMMADLQQRGQFRRDVDDMMQLLDGTLDFLRGKASDEAMQPVDLVALVESLVDDYQDIGEVSLQAPDVLQYSCRPRGLRRALTNLIDNALKYGQRAHVKLTETPLGVEIRVLDDGPGLSPSEMEKVFEPFYRVEQSRSRDTGGSGLGLAIVRQIVQGHGGDVELSNRPEGGLQARLLLPRMGLKQASNAG